MMRRSVSGHSDGVTHSNKKYRNAENENKIQIE